MLLPQLWPLLLVDGLVLFDKLLTRPVAVESSTLTL